MTLFTSGSTVAEHLTYNLEIEGSVYMPLGTRQKSQSKMCWLLMMCRSRTLTEHSTQQENDGEIYIGCYLPIMVA